MAVSHGLCCLRNISPLRGNSVVASLLASVRSFRLASSVITLQRNFSSSSSEIDLETEESKPTDDSETVSAPHSQEKVITPSVNEPVDIHGIKNVLEHRDFFGVHNFFTLRDLFEAKVHFGHHEGCWSPLMKPHLIGSRERYHIINLKSTVVYLRVALNVLSHIVYRNGIILFVNTHPRYEELTQRTARECGEFFITRKWRGGTFTNTFMLTGTMRVPDLVIFLHLPSLGRNTQAVTEAAQANIPSIGIVDSDCNPNLVMYPIPGNDDTPSAVELYYKLFKKAVLRAKYIKHLRRSGKKLPEGEDEESDV